MAQPVQIADNQYNRVIPRLSRYTLTKYDNFNHMLCNYTKSLMIHVPYTSNYSHSVFNHTNKTPVDMTVLNLQMKMTP